jgi:hypothetical protein
VAVSAEQAIRAWINSQPGLTGRGCPLANGAWLYGQEVRSPASGAYARVMREPGAGGSLVAEAPDPAPARITAHVYAGTVQAAERAATALAAAWQGLTGCPEPCGATGVRVLVADNFSDPGYVPMPGSGGEQHMFTTSADFILSSQF